MSIENDWKPPPTTKEPFRKKLISLLLALIVGIIFAYYFLSTMGIIDGVLDITSYKVLNYVTYGLYIFIILAILSIITGILQIKILGFGSVYAGRKNLKQGLIYTIILCSGVLVAKYGIPLLVSFF